MMAMIGEVGSASLSEKDRTACFGRFLVDLPAGAEMSTIKVEYMFGKLESQRVTMDATSFVKMTEDREGLYRGQDRKKGPALVRSYSPNSNVRIIYTVQSLFGDDSFGFEAYALKGGVLFSSLQDSYDEGMFQKTVLPRLDAMLFSLRVRGVNEIPSESGLCIQDAFIGDDGSGRASENVRTSLRFNKWPDLRLSVETMTMIKAEPSLLERLGSAKVPEIFMSMMGQIKTLRRGVHDVGPIKGEESLNMLPTDAGYKVHKFRWESRYELNDPFKPVIVVQLSTGRGKDKDVRPTISEQEAVELFDAVVNSIRLRPTGPAKRSEAAPAPKAPLGEMATTGRQCPQTGRWRAEEGEERLIREGEVMPHTPVSGTASLWQKLRGEAAPIYRSATVWKLVAYEMPPDETPPDVQGHAG
jgi:hypothetical protein